MRRIFLVQEYIGEQAVYGTIMITVAAIPDDIIERVRVRVSAGDTI